jgi:hypothetical protein
MSHFTIIHDVTLELRRRIFAALATAPEVDLGMTSPESDITLRLPTNNMTDTPRLSLYLYYIEADAHLRNQKPLTAGEAGLRFPPLPLELRYLITPLDEAEDQNHLMLGRILQQFHDQPVLTELNSIPLDNSHGGSSAQLRITLTTLAVEQLAQIWGALQTDYHLAVAYTVRTVAIDSDRGLIDAKRVREAFAVVGAKT